MTFLDKFKALLISRRFYVALSGVVVVLLQDVIGLEQQSAMELVALLMAWIVGDSIDKTS